MEDITTPEGGAKVRDRRRLAAVGVLAGLLLVVGVVAAALSNDGETLDASDETTSTTVAEVTTTTRDEQTTTTEVIAEVEPEPEAPAVTQPQAPVAAPTTTRPQATPTTKAPVVTQPPVTQPPVTQPPVTQPPAGPAPVLDHPVTVSCTRSAGQTNGWDNYQLTYRFHVVSGGQGWTSATGGQNGNTVTYTVTAYGGYLVEDHPFRAPNGAVHYIPFSQVYFVDTASC